MTLHGYQREVVDRFAASLNHKRIVIACPTGSGKTAIAIHGIAPLLPRPVLWLTHRVELVRQVQSHNSGIATSTIQSAKAATGYASLVIDEGHHVCASTYRAIMGRNNSATIVALTATPYRMDGVGLGSCGFTKIIYGPDTLWLTQRGYLCPVRVMVPKSESTRSWNPKATAKAISGARFKSAIVYCRSILDAHQTEAELLSLGISASCVDGSMPQMRRDGNMRAFTAGKVKVICNHSILTEGNDVSSVDLVVLNRATESRCLWRQMIGRGVRIEPGKSICTVMDLAGNGITHGSIYDKETFDLNGRVECVESREFDTKGSRDHSEYDYNTFEELKEWKPLKQPTALVESLQRQSGKSLLLRLTTG